MNQTFISIGLKLCQLLESSHPFTFFYFCCFRDRHGIATKKDKILSVFMIALAVFSNMVAIYSDAYALFKKNYPHAWFHFVSLSSIMDPFCTAIWIQKTCSVYKTSCFQSVTLSLYTQVTATYLEFIGMDYNAIPKLILNLHCVAHIGNSQIMHSKTEVWNCTFTLFYYCTLGFFFFFWWGAKTHSFLDLVFIFNFIFGFLFYFIFFSIKRK